GVTSADDRILTVAKSGGEFVSPLSAMNAIKDASCYRRYKIKIGPGRYYLGRRPLRIKPYVSVEGAGTEMTTLYGNVQGSLAGLVRITSNSELSHVTVINNGYNNGHRNQYNAIYVNPGHGTGPSIRHVEARSLVPSDYDYGTGIFIFRNSPRLEDVGTYGKSYGIFINHSSPTLYRVRASAGFDAGSEAVAGAGIYNNKSTVDMDRVSASGYVNIGYGDGLVNRDGSHAYVKDSILGGWIYNDSSSSALFWNSRLKEAVFEGGNFTCLDSYGDDHTKPLSTSCQE
ncbi:MAG: hypothetical protein ACR2QW_01275, partial [bacterium]